MKFLAVSVVIGLLVKFASAALTNGDLDLFLTQIQARILVGTDENTNFFGNLRGFLEQVQSLASVESALNAQNARMVQLSAVLADETEQRTLLKNITLTTFQQTLTALHAASTADQESFLQKLSNEEVKNMFTVVIKNELAYQKTMDLLNLLLGDFLPAQEVLSQYVNDVLKYVYVPVQVQNDPAQTQFHDVHRQAKFNEMTEDLHAFMSQPFFHYSTINQSPGTLPVHHGAGHPAGNPPTFNLQSSARAEESGLSSGAIAAIACGGAALIGAMVIAVVAVRRHRARKAVVMPLYMKPDNALVVVQ